MTADNFEITFRPNPTQKLFIESKARADLFSSRMGEGKSAGLVWSIFYHTWHNPGAQWALIRDSWVNLQDTTMKEFFKWFPPSVAGTYIASRKTFVWGLDGMGGGEVTFLGMDDPSDAGKLQSRELAGFAIDEPAPAASSGGVDEMIFDTALSRLRQMGPSIKWRAAKLAQNNPDETHWTYRRFVDPGEDGFVSWQTAQPENSAHLPPSYYEDLRKAFSHRPDLLRRFVEGHFGFQQIGRAVTPQWSDNANLAVGLTPIKNVPLHLLWDFGHNPTCIVTQVTPMGHWLVLDSMVGSNEGVEELIDTFVQPLLAERYRGFTWDHIGDPAGKQREQTSVNRSAVLLIRKTLGGSWRDGQVKTAPRIEALRAVLNRAVGGTGKLLVDRVRAKDVWHALRGGWHFKVASTGQVSNEPNKNEHSHPGDAMSYGASVLFPLHTAGRGKTLPQEGAGAKPREAAGFSAKRHGAALGFERPGVRPPRDGQGPKGRLR